MTNPQAWRTRFYETKRTFYKRSYSGIKMHVHELSFAAGLPCAVFTIQECPLCYANAPKLNHRRFDLRISIELADRINDLDTRYHARKNDEIPHISEVQDLYARLDNQLAHQTEIMQSVRDVYDLIAAKNNE